jgi:hypothetical protein
MVANCKALLEELDTTFKDKQETERRFLKLEERFGGIEDKMDKLLSAIGKNEN